jgi:Ca2+/Na+ antiporter
VALAVTAGGLGATLGIGLVAFVAVPYLVLLAAGPGRIPSRFLERSFGEHHRRERTIDSRREVLSLVVVLLLALCVIVAGGVGAVRSVNDLADAWSVPQTLVGVLVLATLSALPNAWTGVRFGMKGRGSALMSETLNSNSINLVAGIALPATLGIIGSFSGLNVFGLAWLLGMTAVAVVLFGRRGGGGRAAGSVLIALYAIFVAVQLAVR